MHDVIRLLPSIVRVLIRSRLELQLENLALRHQVTVLQRQRRMRPWLTPFDRALWLYRLWPRSLESLIIVKPETVIRWHRGGLRRYWRWRSRPRGPGRPAVSPEIRGLIRRMTRENPLWGAPRIHGELLKLGIEVSEASVSKYMARYPKPPSQPGGHFSRTMWAVSHQSTSSWCQRRRSVSSSPSSCSIMSAGGSCISL